VDALPVSLEHGRAPSMSVIIHLRTCEVNNLLVESTKIFVFGQRQAVPVSKDESMSSLSLRALSKNDLSVRSARDPAYVV
jgi:hypothetical protein